MAREAVQGSEDTTDNYTLHKHVPRHDATRAFNFVRHPVRRSPASIRKKRREMEARLEERCWYEIALRGRTLWGNAPPLMLERVMMPGQASLLSRTHIDHFRHAVAWTCKVADVQTGELVGVLVKGAIPPNLTDLMDGTRARSRNRGDAAGIPTRADLGANEKLVNGKRGVLGVDGVVRDRAVESNTIGYTRSGKQSYWTKSHAVKARCMRPLFARMMSAYRHYAPLTYAVQSKKCTQRFMDLPLSSVALNHNFRCAVHADRNDLQGTYGVMAVGGDDQVRGGQLIFPEYDVAFNVRKGDVLIFNSHLYHGNAAFLKPLSSFKRISAVAYGR